MTRHHFHSFPDVVKCMADNWPNYVPEFRMLLIAVFIASLADMVSTISVMQVFGPQVELHPLIRTMSLEWGPVLGPVVGKAWQLLALILVTLLLRPQARLILVPVAISYTAAAYYNLWANASFLL